MSFNVKPSLSTKLVVLILLLLSSFIGYNRLTNKVTNKPVPGASLSLPVSIPTYTPSPTPTPRPLTFAEMNSLYGPCTFLPTLYYHHVQSKDEAVSKKQTGLSIYTDIFKTQMQYLKDKNYNVLSINDMVNFFDNETPIPKKSVLLTFDDAYQDFYTDAYPVLKDFGYKAIVFVPTGLINNPGYLTWNEISEMVGNIRFANHTWSHKSVITSENVMKNEIEVADRQLSEHGLNSPKIFAYPYGPDNVASEQFLESLEYKAAFTTKPGSILCKQKRFDLPRIRVGNSPLSSYGF